MRKCADLETLRNWFTGNSYGIAWLRVQQLTSRHSNVLVFAWFLIGGSMVVIHVL